MPEREREGERSSIPSLRGRLIHIYIWQEENHVRDLLGVGVLHHVRVHHVGLGEHPVPELGRREARREREAGEVLVELLAADLVGVRLRVNGLRVRVGVGSRVRVGVGEVLDELLVADLTVGVDDGAQPRGLRLLGQRIELDRASERHTRREAREADLVR